MKDGFITVAAGTPKIRVADCRYNAEQIFTLMREADKQGVKVLALPELCLTGYTCGDLFLQETLLNGAEEGLRTILEATKNLDLIAAANDDRIQEPYRRRLIPDYNAVRDTCLNGGAKTIWISGSGSTLMAVTDDTIVAKFLQVKLREQFPKCDTHILTCDTEGAQIEYL